MSITSILYLEIKRKKRMICVLSIADLNFEKRLFDDATDEHLKNRHHFTLEMEELVFAHLCA